MADTAPPPAADIGPPPFERNRHRADAAARVAQDIASDLVSSRIALETERQATTWQANRIGALEAAVTEANARHRQAADIAHALVPINGALAHLRGVFGMADDEPPLTALARIREEAAAVERARWCEALGLSSMDAAKAYIAKFEGELEAAGKPTPHQPAAPAPAPVTITQTVGEVDPAQVAAAVDKAAAEAKGDGKRRATPRRERFTIAELCATIAEVRARTLGPSNMTEQLPAALAGFVGKVLVKGDVDIATTPADAAPASTAEPMRVLAAPSERCAVRWRAMDNARRLMLVPADRFTEIPLATVGRNGDARDVATILGEAFKVEAPQTIEPPDNARAAASLEETTDQRAEVAVVDSFAAVIASLTGREVLLGERRAPTGGPDVGPG